MIHTSTNTLDRAGLAVKPTGADEKKAYSIKSVSYTHLTLPTNREV